MVPTTINNIKELIETVLVALFPFLSDIQWLVAIIYVGFVLLIAVFTLIVIRYLVRKVVTRFIKKTQSQLDDHLIQSNTLSRGSFLFPLLVLYGMLPPYIKATSQSLGNSVEKFITILLILTSLWTFSSILRAVNNAYSTLSLSKQRPIKGLLQIANLFVIIIGILWVVTLIFNVSPVGILGGVGALSAVVILVFKDTILGITAGVQLSANNLVHIGDWIQIDSAGVDGEVIEINLQTIQVRNWNNTISSLPVYALISEPFINWRGMQQSGGRRIKRALYIDIKTIHFASHDEIEQYKKISLIADYINNKLLEIDEDNRAKNTTSQTDIASSRSITNIGTFRAYVEQYLKSHKHINTNMTLMVRQLQPTPQGVPVEVYAFASNKEWVAYEHIQSDIFDHLFAVLHYFNLRMFQRISDTPATDASSAFHLPSPIQPVSDVSTTNINTDMHRSPQASV